MAAARGPLLAAALLLLSWGHHCVSPPPPCPDLCTCRSDAALINCSSAGLNLVPRHIPDSVAELHLSHNRLPSAASDRPLPRLRALWLDSNGMARLSLCVDRTPGGRRGHRIRPWSGRGCVSWAPALQLLSLERNQLQQLPEGLEGSTSLQVLHVSYNRISTLRAGQFGRLRQLTELHLQHNIITSLHPQTFQGLTQLRVLDLSFNMLTSLHPLMHLSLRSIGAEVKLSGNKWHCDCSMRALRRRMLSDRNRGPMGWNVVCASPPILSGRDLLQLEESELDCSGPENKAELHQDLTVYRGSEVLLSCSSQDSTWLTPNGEVPAGEGQAGLLISDITEGDTGLYVCVSKEKNVLSVFNLQISRTEGTKRKARSLPSTDGQISQDVSDRSIQERNQGGTQTNLALAVCLSVFITFLVAFIIGVIARPWLDVLCQRITNKNSSAEITEVTTVEQRQYENQAFSCCEPGVVCNHRERRVTFSRLDIDENSNLQHYDSVPNESQENNNRYQSVKAGMVAHRAGDSGSETSSQSSREENQRDSRELSGRTDAGQSKNTKLEYIQETNEWKTRRRPSSSSDFSVSDNVDRIKPSQVSEEFIQQRAPQRENGPKSSIRGNENLGFSSEPFDDWSPHAKDSSLTHPEMWKQKEEQFEFSDSAQSSSSSGSVSGSSKNSKQTGKKKWNDRLGSNSRSYASENKITDYTVNQEVDMGWNVNTPDVTKDALKKGASFQKQTHGGESSVISPNVQGDDRYDTKSHATRPKHSFSSSSSNSEDDNTINQKSIAGDEKHSSYRVTGQRDAQQKVVPLPRTKVPGSFVISSHGNAPDGKKPTTPAVFSSSSSSESEMDNPRRKMKQKRNKVIPGTEVRASGNIEETSSDSESSSSRGRKVEINQVQRQEVTPTSRPSLKAPQSASSDDHWPKIDLQHSTRVKRRLDVKIKSPSSLSSSSSDSEDEQNHQNRSQTVRSDQQWPAINFDHTTPVKRRLDIKIKSQHSGSSSSSDSEEETYHKKQDQWQTAATRVPPVKVSPTGSPDHRWPVVNLDRTTKVKRRLDIKVASFKSDTSSSSESEDNRGHGGKQRPTQINVSQYPLQESQSSSSSESEDEQIYTRNQEQWQTSPTSYPPGKGSQSGSPDPRWPVVNLDHTTKVKRRLDIKVASLKSDTSSSSESEDDRGHEEKQRPAQVYQRPLQESQSSSSSSESEDEKIYTRNQEQWQTSPTSYPPVKGSQPGSLKYRWPVINLEHTTKVKRRLDIKVTSHDSDSSSSSDSEDETDHTKRQEQWQTSTRLPVKVPDTGTPEQWWPAIDLLQKTRVKRRLDIKAPSFKSGTTSSSDSEDDRDHNEKQRHVTKTPFKETSSSSSSEDETPQHIKKVENGETSTSRLPIKESQIVNLNQQWPAIDLNYSTRVKRRIDIKIKSPDLDSSFTSVRVQTQRPAKVDTTKPPFEHSSSSSSDSEDDTSHIPKQEQWQSTTTRLPNYTPPTGGPDQQWPVINLERTTKVKRRLDFKALSPKSDTSFSSGSDDDRDPQEKLRPGMIHVSKSPIQKSHSSSSSDSEDDTSHIIKQDQWQTTTTQLPKYTSPTGVVDQQWPAINLEHTTKVKRRLDIKVTTDNSESSSSSDSEDETSHVTKQEKWQTSPTSYPPVKGSQSGSPDPRWPVVNLDHTTKVKRRLDIKVASLKSDTSSSSESEDDRGHGEKQRPAQVYQRPLHESQSSSSSSESEDEKIYTRNQEQWQTSPTSYPPVKGSQSGSLKYRWPVINLEHTTKVKRRLDIKVATKKTTEGMKKKLRPTQVSQHLLQESQSSSSSSSDSDDETRYLTIQEKLQPSTTRFPDNKSPTGNLDHRWPAINLGQTKKVKRRLDIKVASHDSDSSSSSDSENERGHREQQKVWKGDVSHHPIQGSESSFSSDSDDETRHTTEQGQWQMSTKSYPPVKVSHTVRPDHQWPAVNLEHTTRVKRRLDIKVKPHHLESSSSSDSEDETSYITKQEQWLTSTTRFPSTTPPFGRPDNHWPAINFEGRTKIKRRLDIKAQSPKSVKSSSSDSEDDKDRRPKPGPGGVDVFQRPIQEPSSSSSSDSEYETREEQWQTSIQRLPHHTSTTGRPDQQWPVINLQHTTKVKRRLDIKVNTKGDPGDITNRPRPPLHEHHDPDTAWPHLNLLNQKHVQRPLDIKAPSYDSESSSSSDSEDEKGDHAKPGLGLSAVSSNRPKDFSQSSKTPLIRTSSKPKEGDNIKLEKYVIYNDTGDETSNINKTTEVSPELESLWAKMSLGRSRFRKHLEITSGKLETPNPPLSPAPTFKYYTGNDQGTGSTFSTRSPQGFINHTVSPLEPEDKVQKGISGISVDRQRKDSSTSSDSSSSEEEGDIREGWKGRTQSASQIYSSPNVTSSILKKTDPPRSQTQEIKRGDREEIDILGDRDSLISYNRSIFNSSSLMGGSTLPMAYRKHTEAPVRSDEVEGPQKQGITQPSLTPSTIPSMSFDELIKTRIAQSRNTAAVEVPSEIKWKGIGRRLTPSTNQESPLTPKQEPTKTERSLLDDYSISSERDYNIKRGGTDEMLIPKQWKGTSNDPVPSRSLEEFTNSPSSPIEILGGGGVGSDNRGDRKGLSAIKAMSLKRKVWDTHADPAIDASPQFNGYNSPITTRFNAKSSEDHKTQTQLPPYSDPGQAERVQNFLYGIPLYRRHAAVVTSPPPVPETPPPDDVDIPAWKSPQSSQRLQAVRMLPYQSRNAREPSPSTTEPASMTEHLDNPYNNISPV